MSRTLLRFGGTTTFVETAVYRKLLLNSLGLPSGFLEGLINRGAYIQEGLKKGIKNNVWKHALAAHVHQNRFFIFIYW